MSDVLFWILCSLFAFIFVYSVIGLLEEREKLNKAIADNEKILKEVKRELYKHRVAGE